MIDSSDKIKLDEASSLGVDAGHEHYESGEHEPNPYPENSPEWSRWRNGFIFGFDSADFNDS